MATPQYPYFNTAPAGRPRPALKWWIFLAVTAAVLVVQLVTLGLMYLFQEVLVLVWLLLLLPLVALIAGAWSLSKAGFATGQQMLLWAVAFVPFTLVTFSKPLMDMSTPGSSNGILGAATVLIAVLTYLFNFGLASAVSAIVYPLVQRQTPRGQ